MTQPFDRTCQIPARGEIDHDAGEFWVENPFQMAFQQNNLSAYEPNRLFVNVDGRRFADLSHQSGTDIDSDSRSAVVGDFDNDNDPDLLVGSVGGGPLRLFQNTIPQMGSRVRLQLVGVTSNRQAIGSRVIAQCDGRQIVRDLFPANGFMGQNPAEMFLGLGPAKKIDLLTIRWPSGTIQQFEDVPVNCHLKIVEGEGDPVLVATGT